MTQEEPDRSSAELVVTFSDLKLDTRQSGPDSKHDNRQSDPSKISIMHTTSALRDFSLSPHEDSDSQSTIVSPAVNSSKTERAPASIVTDISTLTTSAASTTFSTNNDPNQTELDDHEVTEKHQQRHHHQSGNKNLRGKPSACVFVASLCASLTDDELSISVTKHFRKWGELATVKVLRDTANRPYAFVQYTNDLDSKCAIKYGQDSILGGRRLRCEAAKVNRTLFVTSSTSLTQEQLTAILGKFGEFDDVKPSRPDGLVQQLSKSLVRSKNWFVKFSYRDDAIRAFANLSEAGDLEVEWAQNLDEGHYGGNHRIRNHRQSQLSDGTGEKSGSESPHPDSSSKSDSFGFDKFSVFIGQLSSNITEEELKERFQNHGEIKKSTIVRKPNNTFAFITYEDESSAASAVERENHTLLKDKTMHVQYREIHPLNNKSSQPPRLSFAHAPPPINLMKRSGSIKSPSPRVSVANGVTSTNGQSSSNSYSNGGRKPRYNSGKSTQVKPNSTKNPLKLSSNYYGTSGDPLSDSLASFPSRSKFNASSDNHGGYSGNILGFGNEKRKSYNIFNDISTSSSITDEQKSPRSRASKVDSPVAETHKSSSVPKKNHAKSHNAFDQPEAFDASAASFSGFDEPDLKSTLNINTSNVPYYYYLPPPSTHSYMVKPNGSSGGYYNPYQYYGMYEGSEAYQLPLYYPSAQSDQL